MTALPAGRIWRLAAMTRSMGAVVLLACGAEERPPSGATTLGLSDVTYGSEVVARFPASAMHDAGGLVRVVGATRLQGGNVVVADAGQHQLVVFDPTGREVARYGQRGAGPSEFEGISRLFQCPRDTLVVWDHRLGRLSMFDANGRYLRQLALPHRPNSLACTAAGEIVMSVEQGTPQMSTADAPLSRMDIHVVPPSGENRVVVRDVPLGRNRPLEPFTRIAAGSERFFIGSAESGVVVAYSNQGVLLDSLTIVKDRRPLTAHHFESYVDDLVSIMRPGEEREWGRRQFLQMPRPAFLPAFDALLVDAQGRIWALTSWPGDSATTFAVASFENGPVGTASFPSGVSIYEIGDDYALVRVHADSGAPHVALWRLAR